MRGVLGIGLMYSSSGLEAMRGERPGKEPKERLPFP
jgi:hypothetical protein